MGSGLAVGSRRYKVDGELKRSLSGITKEEAIQTSVFGRLPPELQAKLSGKLHEIDLKEGQFLLKQGTGSGRMCIVAKGLFDVIVSKNGKDVKVDTLRPGDFTGMGSLFTSFTHSASVVAKSDECLAYALEEKDVEALMRENFEIAKDLLVWTQQELRKHRWTSNFPQGRRKSKEDLPSKLKIAFFDAKVYDKETFAVENQKYGFDIHYFEPRLTLETVSLASGCDIVCVFVNDDVSEEVVKCLARLDIKMIALRCAGFNNVGLQMAEVFSISVARVPAYSPYAVAEFAIALAMTLNRKVHIANDRIRGNNFTLDGLVGFDLHGRTVGVLGTGKIGQCFIDICIGFGCKIACYDLYPSEVYAAKAEVTYYKSVDEVLELADVLSLHMPLLPTTKHMINAETLAKMKPNCILINTSRGALVDTEALVDALKNGRLRGAGLDVYENETGYFFEDHSGQVVKDDQLARLQSMPNCLLTSHQAFLTSEALEAIARVTLANCKELEDGKHGEQLTNHVPAPH